jgi:hypothetical protein
MHGGQVGRKGGGQSFRREACWLEESQDRARFGAARIGPDAERQAGLCGYLSDCGVYYGRTTDINQVDVLIVIFLVLLEGYYVSLGTEIQWAYATKWLGDATKLYMFHGIKRVP